jgi:antitoxin HicB
MTKHIGSTFESWLEEDGSRERVYVLAAKKIIVRKLLDAMERSGIHKTALARLMETDRPAIHRLLDPNESGMTLTTLVKAMHVLKIPAIPIVAGAFATKPQRKRPVAAKPVVRSTTRKESFKSTPSKTGSTGFSSRRRKA